MVDTTNEISWSREADEDFPIELEFKNFQIKEKPKMADVWTDKSLRKQRLFSLMQSDLYIPDISMEYIAVMIEESAGYEFIPHGELVFMNDVAQLELMAFCSLIEVVYPVEYTGPNLLKFWAQEFPESYRETGRALDFFIKHLLKNQEQMYGYAFLPELVNRQEIKLSINKKLTTYRCPKYVYALINGMSPCEVTLKLLSRTKSKKVENSSREKFAQENFARISIKAETIFKPADPVGKDKSLCLPSLADTPGIVLSSLAKKKKKARAARNVCNDGMNYFTEAEATARGLDEKYFVKEPTIRRKQRK